METTCQRNNDEKSSLDPMFTDAARFVVAEQDGSVSRLQRQFCIGYNRACRLVEQLEATGVVGSDREAKGREVLIQVPTILEQKLQELGV